MPQAPAILLDIARFGLAILYLASGATKLFALDAFSHVILVHGVLPRTLVDFAWVVPVAEILVGLLVLAFGNHPRWTLPRRTTALGATALPLAFIAYILTVPEPALRSAGCGCGPLLDFLFMPVHIAFNVLLALLGMTLWQPRRARSGAVGG